MFSVVIPSYNHERYITDALLSSMRETLVAEIVVGDDGSKDGSLRLIERAAARNRIIRNETAYPVQNIGAHAMLNRLIAAAQCEWIAVLNSDDMFVPGRFAAISNLIRSTKRDFYFGNIAIIDKESNVVDRKRAFLDPQYDFPRLGEIRGNQSDLLRLLLTQNYIATTSNMVFRKSLWKRIGGFNAYRYVHDWDFALRCMLLGTAKYLTEYLTYYRIHDSNTIKASLILQKAEVRDVLTNLERDFGSDRLHVDSRFTSANGYLTTRPDHRSC